jgi:NAD(P)-dependent dehydrogenase (short-subunit alcohol dehydrogenase family)
MVLSLEGRVALVTGAGRGLGRAYALSLARHGAVVAVNGRSDESVSAVVDEIVRAGGRAVGCAGDLERPGVPDEVVGTAIDEFGRLDIIVNNAGGAEVPFTPFATTAKSHRDGMMQQNFVTAWDVSAAAWPHLVAGGYGRVVLFASPLAFYGAPGAAHYAAAKGALIGLARTMAVEGAEHGITVNVVNPIANTRDVDAFRRWRDGTFSVNHVATALAWLVHECCTITGEIFSIGGSRVARVSVSETVGYICATGLHDPEDIAANLDAVFDGSHMLEFLTMDELLQYLDQLYADSPGSVSN